MGTTELTARLTAQFGVLVGGIIAAVLILLLAWIVAVALRWLVERVLTAVRLDQRLRSDGVTRTISQAVFWLVFLIFLPAVLAALGVPGILDPLTGMINTVLAMIPQLIAAILIFVIGSFIAGIVRQIVTGLLAGVGADRVGARFGFPQLSSLLGTVVYILILIPTLIGALQALRLSSLTDPLTAMLTNVLNAVPGIIAAGVLLVLAYYIGRVVAELVTNLLQGLGFDRILSALGISRAQTMTATTTTAGALPTSVPPSPSRIAGGLVLTFIVYTAATQAAYMLGWNELGDLLAGFLTLAVRVILGLIIVALGLWLGNMLAGIVRASNLPQRNLLAVLAQAGIFALFAAMGLTQMGLGQEIVVLAFGLTLGAVALASALAFGLGGRDTAAQVLQDVRRSVQSGEAQARLAAPPPPVPPVPPTTPPAGSAD